MKGREYKLAIFADYVLFLTNPIVMIANLMKALVLFHQLSNLKINFGKSTALNITLGPDTVRQYKAVFPF